MAMDAWQLPDLSTRYVCVETGTARPLWQWLAMTCPESEDVPGSESDFQFMLDLLGLEAEAD